MWRRLCWKIPCASANGIRRGRRKSWACRLRRCWRSCGVRGWRNSWKSGPRKKAALQIILIFADGGVEGDGAEGPDAIVHGRIADSGKERGEFGRAEEPGNRFW